MNIFCLQKSVTELFQYGIEHFQNIEEDIISFRGDEEKRSFAMGNLIHLYSLFQLCGCPIAEKSHQDEILSQVSEERSYPIRLAYLLHIALTGSINNEQARELRCLLTADEPEHSEIVTLSLQFVSG